ncbi:Reticulon-4 [Sarcoptes scabiei]|nr:Reticulon-4 [Sarcoptes scabiei]
MNPEQSSITDDQKDSKLFEHPTLINPIDQSNETTTLYELDSNFSICPIKDEKEMTENQSHQSQSITDSLASQEKTLAAEKANQSNVSNLINLNETLMDPNDFIIPSADQSDSHRIDLEFKLEPDLYGDGLASNQLNKTDATIEQQSLKNENYDTLKNSENSFDIQNNFSNICEEKFDLLDMSASNISRTSENISEMVDLSLDLNENQTDHSTNPDSIKEKSGDISASQTDSGNCSSNTDQVDENHRSDNTNNLSMDQTIEKHDNSTKSNLSMKHDSDEAIADKLMERFSNTKNQTSFDGESIIITDESVKPDQAKDSIDKSDHQASLLSDCKDDQTLDEIGAPKSKNDESKIDSVEKSEENMKTIDSIENIKSESPVFDQKSDLMILNDQQESADQKSSPPPSSSSTTMDPLHSALSSETKSPLSPNQPLDDDEMMQSSSSSSNAACSGDVAVPCESFSPSKSEKLWEEDATSSITPGEKLSSKNVGASTFVPSSIDQDEKLPSSSSLLESDSLGHRNQRSLSPDTDIVKSSLDLHPSDVGEKIKTIETRSIKIEDNSPATTTPSLSTVVPSKIDDDSLGFKKELLPTSAADSLSFSESKVENQEDQSLEATKNITNSDSSVCSQKFEEKKTFAETGPVQFNTSEDRLNKVSEEDSASKDQREKKFSDSVVSESCESSSPVSSSTKALNESTSGRDSTSSVRLEQTSLSDNNSSPSILKESDLKLENPLKDTKSKSEVTEMARKNYNRQNSSENSQSVSSEPDYLHQFIQTLFGQCDILYWRDPKNSGAVFGIGLVILFSLTIFSVISVVAYTLLFSLLGTLSFRVYKNVMQAVNKTEEGHPFKEYLDMDITPNHDRAHEIADQLMSHFNCFINRMRSVLLVENYVESFKYLFLFWVLTFIGAWFNGMTLVILAYIGAFSVPKVYEMNKTQIDQYLNLIMTKISEVSEKIPFLKNTSTIKKND